MIHRGLITFLIWQAFAEAWPDVPQHHVRCNAAGTALPPPVTVGDSEHGPAAKKQKSKL